MSPIAPALAQLSAEIAELSTQFGRRVEVAALGVTDREGQLPLAPPGIASPNGACRLARAADGWIAVNLAREEDRDLVPAWLGCDFGVEPWEAIGTRARGMPCRELVAGAELLGLPAARVGEVMAERLEAPLVQITSGGARSGRPKVIDLSALWAGPLCGAVLAAAGCEVTKVESTGRPDASRISTPEFFRQLNGAKTELPLDLGGDGGRTRLRDMILAADAVITSARPRGLDSLGLSVEEVFAIRPDIVWVAINGYGWTQGQANRVAFGDDAAAAGGLVRWTTDGEPRFLGDALSDPVTGLAAAVGALNGLLRGGGVLVDAALARSAAGAASVCGLGRAA